MQHMPKLVPYRSGTATGLDVLRSVLVIYAVVVWSVLTVGAAQSVDVVNAQADLNAIVKFDYPFQVSGFNLQFSCTSWTSTTYRHGSNDKALEVANQAPETPVPMEYQGYHYFLGDIEIEIQYPSTDRRFLVWGVVEQVLQIVRDIFIKPGLRPEYNSHPFNGRITQNGLLQMSIDARRTSAELVNFLVDPVDTVSIFGEYLGRSTLTQQGVRNVLSQARRYMQGFHPQAPVNPREDRDWDTLDTRFHFVLYDDRTRFVRLTWGDLLGALQVVETLYEQRGTWGRLNVQIKQLSPLPKTIVGQWTILGRYDGWELGGASFPTSGNVTSGDVAVD